ncbi:HlyD family secretion protein [Fulvimarina sp. MAC3]|uniref:HlyD family secretion protein n=1 Tax=Fulvimarina sp. MAC3 TaxID=3148887 RepID=UPI0031FC9E7D
MIVIRLLLTAAIVIAAIFGVVYIWTTYFENPWTRDAHVRADVVEIASYVPGTITELNVVDNQEVKKGDVILRIDQRGYETSVAQAQAQVAQAEAEFRLQQQQAARLTELENQDTAAIANVKVANAQLQATAAKASLEAAREHLRAAQIDLERTTIEAPVSGYITNLTADTGDFVSAGNAFMAIVDKNSFRIDAYFMETKLPGIKVGDAAKINLMANSQVLKGKVQGIARGIYREQGESSELLEMPKASFQWIRLAQRVPVQIAILELPDGIPLVSGTTATVIIEPTGDDRTQNEGVFDWIGRKVTGLFASLH